MPAFPPPTTVLPDYLAPTGFTYSAFPRNAYSNINVTPTTGTLFLTSIALPAGFRVGKIGFHTGTTGVTTPTHYWFGLYDSSRVQLATTADQLTAAWASSTMKSLTIATTAAGAATSFTTTYTGQYYLGLLITATTMPTLPATAVSAAMATTAPIVGGASTTGLTTPTAFPTTATAITGSTNPPYATVGS